MVASTATNAVDDLHDVLTVIIKGTQVYDSGKGKFVDLSVLDVLQVFGRAGRPGLETSGEGYICTSEDKLDHYLDAVNSQVCSPSLCLSSELIDVMFCSLEPYRITVSVMTMTS